MCLKEVDATLSIVLSRMQELAKSRSEYSVVREMLAILFASLESDICFMLAY